MFDFTEIAIGEGITLTITTQHPDEDLPPSLDKTQITGEILTRETRIHRPQMSATAGSKAKRVSRTNRKEEERKVSTKSKSYAFKQLLVVIFLAGSLLIYEFFLTDTAVQTSNQIEPKAGAKKSNVAITTKKQPKANDNQDSSNNIKKSSLSKECKKLFIESDPEEIIIQGDSPEEIIIYREYFHTLRVFFVTDTEGYLAQEKNPKILPVLASLNLLHKGVLTSLEAKQINKIRINIYKKYGDNITEKFQYNLDTDQYKRINSKEVELAFEKVKISGDYSYFDKYVIQHLEAVSGK